MSTFQNPDSSRPSRVLDLPTEYSHSQAPNRPTEPIFSPEPASVKANTGSVPRRVTRRAIQDEVPVTSPIVGAISYFSQARRRSKARKSDTINNTTSVPAHSTNTREGPQFIMLQPTGLRKRDGNTRAVPFEMIQQDTDSRPLNVARTHAPFSEIRRPSLSRKPDVPDLRRGSNASALPNPPTSGYCKQRNLEIGQAQTRRLSLNKPLPAAPSDELATELQDDREASEQLKSADEETREHINYQPNAYAEIDDELRQKLQGVITLGNTSQTTHHQTWATPVTHENITRTEQEVREERIEREIHNHHVFHRILPVVDIEVRPARHFVLAQGGGYIEISADEVPAQSAENAKWMIAETVSKLKPPESSDPILPTHFTARKFEGSEGDDREYITSEGWKRTETWWVHPPRLEDGGRETGQTYPFYFASSSGEGGGLCAELPEGEIVGVSPLFAQQQMQRTMSANASVGQDASDAVA